MIKLSKVDERFTTDLLGAWIRGQYLGFARDGRETDVVRWKSIGGEPDSIGILPGAVVSVATSPDQKFVAVACVHPADPAVLSHRDNCSLMVFDTEADSWQRWISEEEEMMFAGLEMRLLWSPKSSQLAVGPLGCVDEDDGSSYTITWVFDLDDPRRPGVIAGGDPLMWSGDKLALQFDEHDYEAACWSAGDLEQVTSPLVFRAEQDVEISFADEPAVTPSGRRCPVPRGPLLSALLHDHWLSPTQLAVDHRGIHALDAATMESTELLDADYQLRDVCRISQRLSVVSGDHLLFGQLLS